MAKLRLELEDLAVESFQTTPAQAGAAGTVHGQGIVVPQLSQDLRCASPLCVSAPGQTCGESCNSCAELDTCAASCNGTCGGSCNGTCYGDTCDASCRGSCGPLCIPPDPYAVGAFPA